MNQKSVYEEFKRKSSDTQPQLDLEIKKRN